MPIQANHIYNENCMQTVARMPNGYLNCVVTSPPYFGLRDYGNDEQFGAEDTPEAFVANLVGLFREIKRVLRDDGTVWLNLGDSYAAQRGGTHQPAETLAGGKKGYTDTGEKVNRSRNAGYNPTRNAHQIGLKHKDLIGIPWRVAFALQADGWYLRQDIIWHKPNPMPESVTDRCTKSHEYVFLLSKSAKYWYDHEAIKEPVKHKWGIRDRANGKYHKEGTGLNPHSGLEKEYDTSNKRSVWSITTKPYKGAHFATFPEKLIEPCILAGCPNGGIVYDPFMGSGTTALVAHRAGRQWIGSELNPDYLALANKRLAPVVNQQNLF